MPIPRFRFGGYMNATGGGTMASASSSYSSPSSSSNNYGSPPDVSGYNAPSPAPQITGRIRDTKADEEANESSYLNTMMPGGNITYSDYQEGVANTAYQASKKKQQEMQKAIALAYSQDGSSNFQNLDNDQKQQLIDSGFAAAESSGVLGGTFGAEIVSNQIKQELANAKTEDEYYNALDKLDRLNANLNTKIDPATGKINPFGATDMQEAMGLLNFDPSAVYSFGSDIDRYKGGTYLKDAFYDMQNKNLTPKEYTNYMNKISAFGHSPQTGSGFGGGGGGGYGYGSGGGGGGGGGGYYYGTGGGSPQTYQRGQVGPGNLQEQVNQAFLSGGKPFAKGGIVSLVEA
jgi:hypothetical protein